MGFVPPALRSDRPTGFRGEAPTKKTHSSAGHRSFQNSGISFLSLSLGRRRKLRACMDDLRESVSRRGTIHD